MLWFYFSARIEIIFYMVIIRWPLLDGTLNIIIAWIISVYIWMEGRCSVTQTIAVLYIDTLVERMVLILICVVAVVAVDDDDDYDDDVIFFAFHRGNILSCTVLHNSVILCIP